MYMKTYSHDDWQLINEEVCFSGFFKLVRYHFRHKLFDGSTGPQLSREVFVRGDATCVLLYDPKLQSLVLVEQFRAGGVLYHKSPWMFELVAGINEEGELPEEVACREAVEEADAKILDLMHIMDFFPSPGGSTERIYLFLGLVDAQELGGVHGLAEEGEDIKVHVLGLPQVVDMLNSGEIDNSPAIIAIQWLLLNKEKVDEAWGRSFEK